MRLSSLSLRNWGVHWDLEVDLCSGLQIEGRNGTGKSSILEAIRFVFSESAHGYKSFIRNGTRSTTVKLSFVSEGKNYSVEKTLYTDNPSKAAVLCDSVQVADNPSTTYSVLKTILDENVLDRLLYVRQNSLTSIIDRLRLKEGKQELDQLFGLDRLEEVYSGVLQEVRDSKTRLDVLGKQVAKYPENALQEYEKNIKELEDSIRDLEARKKELEAESTGIRKDLMVADSDLRDLEGKRKKIHALKDELHETEVTLAGLRKELESLENELKDLDKKKSEVKEVEVKASQLSKFKTIQELLTELNGVREQLAGLGDVNENEKQLAELNKEVDGIKDLEDDVMSKEKNLRELEEGKTGLKTRLDEARKYLSDLGSLDHKAKCPRCSQPLTREHLDRERGGAEGKLAGLEEKVSKIDTLLKSAGPELQKIRKHLEELRGKKVRAAELEKRVKEIQDHRKKLDDKSSSLEKKLSENDYTGEPLTVVEARVTEYSRLHGRIDACRRDIQRSESLLEKKDDVGSLLSSTSKKSSELKNRLVGTEFDEREYSSLRERREKLQESLYKLSSEVDRIGFTVKENRKKADEIESMKNEFLETKSRVDAEENQIKLLEQAREVFHTNKGLPKYLREQYITKLSRLLTYYFKKFNQNPRYRDVQFNREYMIEVKTTQGVLSLDQLSGGEKTQLALALRIALIDLLSPIRLLILDEPFGSLDYEHRELLGESLNKIASTGQLILVTHVHVDSLQMPSKLELGGY